MINATVVEEEVTGLTNVKRKKEDIVEDPPAEVALVLNPEAEIEEAAEENLQEALILTLDLRATLEADLTQTLSLLQSQDQNLTLSQDPDLKNLSPSLDPDPDLDQAPKKRIEKIKIKKIE